MKKSPLGKGREEFQPLLPCMLSSPHSQAERTIWEEREEWNGLEQQFANLYSQNL
jgi:hypothetical protein